MLTKEIRNIVIDIRNGDRRKIEILFKHYYYFVTKNAFVSGDLLENKELAEDILINAIEEYLTNPIYDGKYDLAHFIRNRFINFENKVYPIKSNTPLENIEKKAYSGDEKALQIMFLRNQYIIDDYAEKYYEIYLSYVKLYLFNNNYYKFLDIENYDFESFISLEDIKQDLYILIWKKIKKYYSNEHNQKYLSVVIHGVLRDGNQKYINYLKEISHLNYIEGFNPNVANKISFEQFLEDKEQGDKQYNKIMRTLDRKVNDGCKEAIMLSLQGYGPYEIGKKLKKSKGYLSYSQKEAQKALK